MPEAQNNLGNLYLSINEHKKAVASYQKAIKIDSRFFISHYNLGVTLKNLGKKGSKWNPNEKVKK